MFDDEGAQAVRLRGLFTERPPGLKLVPGEATAGRGDLGQDQGVSRQVLLRNCFHSGP